MTMHGRLDADAIRNFDLRRVGADFFDDPYPTYRALRESDPVHRQPDGGVFLTRYDDCVAGGQGRVRG